MTLVAQVDSVKIKEWLSQIKTDAANALLYAVDDGLFANFVTTEKVLDVTLDNDDRPPILPFSSQIGVRTSHNSYTKLYGDRNYDVVILANVLEHFNNPISILCAAYNQLEIGGRLIISVPHRDLYEKKLFTPSRFASEHKRFYTLDRLLVHVQAACGNQMG